MNTLNLDPGESIVLEVRKHWFVFFAYGFGMAIAALLPFVLYEAVINFLETRLPSVSDISALFWFLYSFWLLALWMAFFLNWTNYYLDVWYITEKRIIDVDQKGMFHREVSSLRFDKIQDISIEVKGLLAHFLNYGDIRVQTAAEDSKDFFIKHASRPERIRQVAFTRHNLEAEKPIKVISNGKVS